MYPVTYDAFLLVSFGGPEGPDDVMPFLRNVTRGRGIPDERLAAVAEHYDHFGGVSPINAQCRELLDALRPGFPLPVYWGNRNWAPLLTDTVTQLRDDGRTNVLAFVTSPFGSYSSCRQYLEDIERARAAVPGAPPIDKIRHYHDHPDYIAPHADAVHAALATLPDRAPARTRLVFTAHSIPSTMDAASGPGGAHRYTSQLRETAALVAAAAAPELSWDLVWQSRSGPPQMPWLEPDVNDHLAKLAQDGITEVVVSPIGFISDHLEVLWDLDVEAKETARRLGLGFARAATPGADPRFVQLIRELVAERTAPETAVRRALGSVPTWDVCPADCCVPVTRPTR